ncbi:hypothetical protein M011DRAFT_461077 [Sporormia fimetaria CBS 119925]|uniref:tRNA-intron lyase n=1 Tax=Sporormia fimetaria CBS 119925 TaxID=1340428 RepID=A0A6A6V513_9PLEO|nr:hypothetical protein M011DRAFT_461077 [Sporormia fimetaria CBS 119925]
MGSVTEPFPISRIGGRYLLFDTDIISHTRREHNICGVLTGTLPNLSQQNVFLGVPLELMPEEARVLVEQGHAYILDDEEVHRKAFLNMSREDRLAYLQYMDNLGSEAYMNAKKQSEQRAAKAMEQRGLVPKATDPKEHTTSVSSAHQPQDARERDEESLFDSGKTTPAVTAKTKLDTYWVTPTASHPPLPTPAPDHSLPLPEVPRSYPLFRYMHSKGYYSTPGLRFGCQYTIYPGDPLRFHSHFLGTGLDWDDEFDLLDVVGGGRLGTGVKKSYLLGGEDPSKPAAEEGQLDVKAVRAFSIEWAGHPSALFDAKDSNLSSSPLALLSPPEAELLSSLGHLSRLHRRTRDHIAEAASSHPSTICRAVATAIRTNFLERFQRKILDVESRILKHDASVVGAYNIVPLAGIVSEFSEWTRLMEWLWALSSFMMRPGTSPEQDVASAASGAAIIDKLRAEAQTGYPDIESAASELSIIAETAWLRQLATWVLYGRLPSFGASDFFITAADGEDDLSFVVNHKLLPKFVTRATASSIMFIGKSLNQVRSLGSSSKALSSSPTKDLDPELLSTHVTQLADVVAPISSAKLSRAISNIRLSLSRNLLQHLLPQERIVEILSVLHQFFLLGRGEFAVALITEADLKVQNRHKSSSNASGQGIRGILLKEAEMNNALSRVWTILAALGGEDDSTGDVLDLATDIVHLAVDSGQSSSQRPGTPGRAREAAGLLPVISDVVFGDLLLAVPTKLAMDIPSPLDLFMSKADLNLYSAINSYLLAFRRAHLHLGQLWRHGPLRREQPAFPATRPGHLAALARRRERYQTRSREMRKVWATCSAAVFFLSESEAYFQGQVVQESFTHFLQWVTGPADSEGRSTVPSIEAADETTKEGMNRRQHDPEALSLAHRQFLSSITRLLLLTDQAFTKAIREFFTHVDELVALITRLQAIRQHLDLEEDDGVEDYMTNYKQEEAQIALQLDRARRRLDSDMKTVISRLRDIDSERVGSTVGGSLAGSWTAGEYEPLRVGGIDTLLMKLDWGSAEDEKDAYDLI